MIKEQLQTIDGASLNMTSGAGLIMSIVLGIVMFGIALGIKGETLKGIFTKPKSIITGIILQWLGLPLVTFLLIIAFNHFLTPMVCLGMILVASCPGGNISNFMSSLSHSNVELSVSLSAVSTVCSPVITPFNFWFWGNLYLKFASLSKSIVLPDLEIPFSEIFRTVFLILAIPVILGIVFSKYLPKAAEKMKKPLRIFSLLVFAAMVIGMFTQNWDVIKKYVGFIFLIVLVHNACAFGTGAIGSGLMKLPRRDRRTIAIEVGIQNSGLGLTLLLNPAIFKPEIWNNPETGIMYGGMLCITSWWGIWHIISGLALSAYYRKRPLPEDGNES